MPQRSVLCALLFYIYINNLDDNVVDVSKFADGTKNGGIVDNEEGYLSLQNDLDQLGRWAKKWQVKFNSEKCEMLYFGMSPRAGVTQ